MLRLLHKDIPSQLHRCADLPSGVTVTETAALGKYTIANWHIAAVELERECKHIGNADS